MIAIIKDQGTPFERTEDMISDAGRDAVVKSTLAQWNATGILTVYKGNGGAYCFFVAKTKRAIQKWMEENGFVGSNKDAFRQYCLRYTLEYVDGEVIFWNDHKFPDRKDYEAWRLQRLG